MSNKKPSLLDTRWFWPLAGLLIGLAAVLVMALVILPALAPHAFAGTLLQSPEPAYDFSLQGPQGGVRLSQFRGKVVLLFFGYGQCPDVCPATLVTMSHVINRLGERAGQVQAVWVSVDPERDTPASMQRLLSHYNPAILGITSVPPDLELMETIAGAYGVFFQKRDVDRPCDEGPGMCYLVDHTATTMLIDPQGYLRVVYPFGTTADEISADVEYILTH